MVKFIKKINISKLIVVTLSIFMVLSLIPYNVFAAPKDFEDLHGKPRFNTEKVKIEAGSYHDVDGDGNLETLPNLVRIHAGDKTSYIPYIKNIGDTCNLRIKMYADAGGDTVEILKYAQGFQDDWIEKDGWFYYKKPFNKNEVVTVCTSFLFPEDWKYWEHNILDVTVDAEAVADENMPVSTGVATGDERKDVIIFGGLALIIMVLTVALIAKAMKKKDEEKIL